MTARRGAEAGSGEQALARHLLDSVTVGLALLDQMGVIVTANRAAEAFLGYARGELAGRSLADLYVPEEGEAAARKALESASADERIEDEGWRVRADGSRVRACFVLAALPVPGGGGEREPGFTLEVHAARLVPQVESELRARLAREEERRQQAEEASRARDEFLATLSHELRTPLTAIMGWAHLLRTGSLDAAARERALETIERNAHLEAQLTADLLDVARIITGKLRLQIQSVEAARIVEAAVESVRQHAEAKHVDLRLSLDGGAGAIAGDPDRLHQVIGNLLTNAVKFTPEGGEVRVRVAARADQVTIEVSDTGDGIPPDVLPHIFDRFRQGGARARGKGGLGLGLAIVHHIVDLHAGHVHAESRGPGRGATFTVELPSLSERPVPAVAASPERLDSPRLHDVTVLVVDDQEDARELMCAVLGRCGARVVAVDSTAAALEAMDRVRPDVLLSDLEMPGEDGYSLIRKIRQRPADQGGTVPAAALTAYARTEDRLHSLRAGFHRHVPKPVQPDELAEIVASLAGRGR